MKSSEPPRLATWLLEHLALDDKNEGLVGDLVEEFRQGRSVTWYWRQVLGAMFIRCLNGLHRQGGAIVFAIGCTCVVAAVWQFTNFDFQSQFLPDWVARHGRPMPRLYLTPIHAITKAVFLMAGLSLYLAVMRSFELKRFFCGSLVGLLALIIPGVAFPLVFSGVPHISFPHVGWDLPWNHWKVFTYTKDFTHTWGPWWGSLLLSMWAARPDLAQRTSNKISA